MIYCQSVIQCVHKHESCAKANLTACLFCVHGAGIGHKTFIPHPPIPTGEEIITETMVPRN